MHFLHSEETLKFIVFISCISWSIEPHKNISTGSWLQICIFRFQNLYLKLVFNENFSKLSFFLQSFQASEHSGKTYSQLSNYNFIIYSYRAILLNSLITPKIFRTLMPIFSPGYTSHTTKNSYLT